MNILEKIVAVKKQEIARHKALNPYPILEQSAYFNRKTLSLKENILNAEKSGIIAEFKRKSPSKGIINEKADVKEVTIGYATAGASGLSVLTDQDFFGGKNEDLTTARQYNEIPVLRKEFIIDEYQVVEAKSVGADAILLIAAILNPGQIKTLARFAESLKMEVLLELHTEDELRHLNEFVDLVGINNRNLKDFSVNMEKSIQMAGEIPKGFVKIAESGISSVDTLLAFKQNGFDGFLMGEMFMKNNKPEEACRNFIHELPYFKKNK
ncbi:MAG: indole-3-glycerol phosphate synthase TrpC [Bacteroidales bacterium]